MHLAVSAAVVSGSVASLVAVVYVDADDVPFAVVVVGELALDVLDVADVSQSSPTLARRADFGQPRPTSTEAASLVAAREHDRAPRAARPAPSPSGPSAPARSISGVRPAAQL